MPFHAGAPDAIAAETLPDVLQFMRLLWAVVHGLERTSKRMSGAMGVTGTRYEVPPIPSPSCGVSRTWMRVSHFVESEPGQPGTNRRSSFSLCV